MPPDDFFFFESKSMSPRVYNRKTEKPPKGAIYIGRPTIWGNPYVIGRDGTREQVVDWHRKKVLADKTFQQLIREKLKGKNLVCFCDTTKELCHGLIYLEIANKEE